MGYDAELLAVAGSVGVSQIISNGSFVDFDYDSLSGWMDLNTGNGVTTQETFDSRSVFKLDGGATFASNNTASVSDTTAYSPSGDRVVLTFFVYLDSLGPKADLTSWLIYRFHYALNFTCSIELFSDEIDIVDSSVVKQKIGSQIPETGKWIKITLDVTGVLTPASAICDLYYEDTLIGAGIDCAFSNPSPAGSVRPFMLSRDTPIYTQRIAYMDRHIIGDGFA